MYSPWINTDAVEGGRSGGDFEQIEEVIEASGPLCAFPEKLQCRVVGSHVPYDETGQDVTCDTKHGLNCFDDDQFSGVCSDYEVRIGCHNNIRCGPELCPEITDGRKCPNRCPRGHVCDGFSCVDPLDCPCKVENQKFSPGKIIMTSNCERCKCIMGHSQCVEQVCPACPWGEYLEVSDRCDCLCIANATTTEETTTEEVTTTEEETTTEEITTYKPLPVCHVAGDSFTTFDGVQYVYEICDHVLMEDAIDFRFTVSELLHCPADVSNRRSCQRELSVFVDNEVIIILPDLQVVINGIEYSLNELSSVELPGILLSAIGSQVSIDVYDYGFMVLFDTFHAATITITEPHLLSEGLLGLCGYYDNSREGDLLDPDGLEALTIEEFGDSWGSRQSCIPSPTCPEEVLNAASAICDTLYDAPFDRCHDVVGVEQYMSSCLEEMCECLLANGTSTAECKCEALAAYVYTCNTAQPVSVDWRIPHGCAPKQCPPGQIWQDCGTACERTCRNWDKKDLACTMQCVPGCFCPPGYVRRGDQCVLPETCLDCVCVAYGDPHYYSFDGTYSFFNGNCTYVLARDAMYQEFEVLAINQDCHEQPETTCSVGVIVNYQSHIVEIHAGSVLLFDGVSLTDEDLPYSRDGVTLEKVGLFYVVDVPAIGLNVRYTDMEYQVQVKVPSTRYFNRTEGLCGPCNHDPSDDWLTYEGFITDDVNEFGYSWLYEEDRSPDKLCTKEPPKCDYGNPTTICEAIWGDGFKKCHSVVDPSMFYKSCQMDVKCTEYRDDINITACSSLSVYAFICALNGICLEWRSDDLCPIECDGGMEYQECGVSCTMDCDNYETYDPAVCDGAPVSGCFCPNGTVFKDHECQDVSTCYTCDAEGHVVGESWQVDECTMCICTEDGKACTHEVCQMPQCPHGERPQQLPLVPGECCSDYRCECDPDQCPEIFTPNCPYDQQQVFIEISECCKAMTCECPPPEACKEFEIPNGSLRNGEVLEQDYDYCCPVFNVVCNESTCPPSMVNCDVGYLTVPEKAPGECCTTYTCVCDPTTCPEVSVPRCEYDQVAVDTNSGGCCRFLECSCPPEDSCPPLVMPHLQPGQVLRRDENYCCETYHIVCAPEECAPPPLCPPGYRLVEEQLEDACCPDYTCLYPENTCLYNQTVAGGRIEVVEYEAGEEWNDGICKHCQCVPRLGGAPNMYDAACYIEDCPILPPGYVFEDLPDVCCPPLIKIRCECGNSGELCDEGDTWPSENGNPCQSYVCVRKASGDQVVEQLKEQTCFNTCKPTESYREPRFGECCGECVVDKCKDGGEIYEIGEQWNSTHKDCYIMSCLPEGKLIEEHVDCPPITCTEDLQVVDGCCIKCKPPVSTTTPSSGNLGTCAPVPLDVDPQLTIRVFYVKLQGGVTCSNLDPVTFVQCDGTCRSSSIYDPGKAVFENDCKCCSVLDTREVEIVLSCDNGRRHRHKYLEPKSCTCIECDALSARPPATLATGIPAK